MARAGGRTPRVTIYDVANEAGVSKSLVSLVLNGSDQVSDEKRTAVRSAIQKLGYRPSRAAANLAAARTRTIGVVVDDFRNPWFVELLDGLRAVLGRQGFQVAIEEHHELDGRRVNAVDGFLNSQVDGLVIAAEPGRHFDQVGVPTVLVGERLHQVQGADRVTSDPRVGIGLAVDHLRAQGHEAIGYVTGAGGSAHARLGAYVDVMRELGLEPRFVGGDNDTNEEGGYLGTRLLFEQHPEVSAVLAANDTMALGALAALRELALRVPEDVALVGYDNSLLARSRLLDLTTVDNRGQEVGELVGRIILARLKEPRRAPQEMVMSPRLVVRSSSGSVQ